MAGTAHILIGIVAALLGHPGLDVRLVVGRKVLDEMARLVGTDIPDNQTLGSGRDFLCKHLAWGGRGIRGIGAIGVPRLGAAILPGQRAGLLPEADVAGGVRAPVIAGNRELYGMFHDGG